MNETMRAVVLDGPGPAEALVVRSLAAAGLARQWGLEVFATTRDPGRIDLLKAAARRRRG